MLRTSITPEGRFLVALHRPSYTIANYREKDWICTLGHTENGTPCDNRKNFPEGNIEVAQGKWIYEIPNAFPFRGATFIDSEWADRKATDPSSIGLHPAGNCSLKNILQKYLKPEQLDEAIQNLPLPVLYGLAANSTDADELVMMAEGCCRIEHNANGAPTGLRYVKGKDGKLRPDIDNFELFETIANNPSLPDPYKEVMVLRPGVQGESEIVGEWQSPGSHVFEYSRSNSYIPWGHYASNMAHDAIRYRTHDLSLEDMLGLRHLYYQRMFCVMAEKVGVTAPGHRETISPENLDTLRMNIIKAVNENTEHLATLWGWNFGYDFASSGYRLHASHQMIHQQFATVPETVITVGGKEKIPAYSSGDLIADVVERYSLKNRSDFFSDFLAALRNNTRTDGKKSEQSLVVWEDENVVLFVPKAQVSQWELQLLVTADSPLGPVGNALEADRTVRRSIDRGILIAQRFYAGLNARMVTSIEFSKRVGVINGQRLFYSFLPKLPWSMGAFSEEQMRFICGHYPEDFAACCRRLEINITD